MWGKNFTQRSFLPTEAFTYRSFYAKIFLRTETFTHRSFYTQKFSHKKSLYTQELLHKKTCTHGRVYTVVFTRRSFCKSLYLSFIFRIIRHLSSSYLRFHALLVHSLRRLVFISHGVLCAHASSSLPPRRSKLNENPGRISV